MTTFRVGEIAIIQCAILFPEFNGAEVTVLSIGEEGRHLGKSYKGIEVDLISPLNGLNFVVFPHQLRKKRPPRSAKAIMRAAILKAKQPQMVPA